MEFDNTFTVQAPIATVWPVMINPHEVAPCVPGAQITEAVDETHFKGTVKVKLGAVQMSYRGELEMQTDQANHTIVLRAKGTETRGSGGASGVITTRLTESEAGATKVEIHSQIDVTGRVAQFGRGIMQDVATRLIKDFASCLESKLSPPEQHMQEQDDEPGAGAAQEGVRTDAPSADVGHAESARAAGPVATRKPEAEQGEIKMLALLGDVARTRLATWLRLAAEKIEPR